MLWFTLKVTVVVTVKLCAEGLAHRGGGGGGVLPPLLGTTAPEDPFNAGLVTLERIPVGTPVGVEITHTSTRL